MTIIEQIYHQITHYITQLDWMYILTFILIAYGINNRWMTSTLKKTTNLRIKTRYRITFVGIAYATALYFIRGYTLLAVENLFQSFVFALVFHKLIIDTLLGFIRRKINPKKTQTIPIDTKAIQTKSNQNGQL